MIHSFFPQLTDQGTPKLLSHLVRVYFYGMVEVSAVFLLYTLQFNSAVHIEKFDKFYRAMCDVQAEFMVHKAMFSREEWSDATTNAYQEYILSPLEDQFASIKREFKENLYLLSPMPPDGSRVLEFVNDKYPKQFDAFKQAAANNVDAAYKACDSGDYVAALKILRPLADQSNAQAQYLLGYLYDQGRGVAQNDVEAVKWYRLAADQGEAGAQYNLGNMYLQGRGVVQDDVEAVRWLCLAADQGSSQAQSNLGVMYDCGRGVPQNDVEAVKWYRLAADQSEAGAQYNLSKMYLQGRGVVQDDVEAVEWLRLAADHGSAEAQYNLGAMYEMGRGVTQNYVDAYRYYSLSAAGLNGEEQNQAIENRDKLSTKMTAQQVAEGQRLAQDWKPKK